MPYIILITPTASLDLEATIEFYNLQAWDLGYRFAALVEEYLNRIGATPTASPIRYKNVRCKPLATFPYLIMFTINEPEASVSILRILHTRQNPLW